MVILIFFLISSFFFQGYVFFKKKINLASNYTVFVFFSVIYSLFPILTFYDIEPNSTWFAHYSLNESESLVSIQIILIALCNYIFAFVYNNNYKIPSSRFVNLIKNKKPKNIIFLLYSLTCILISFFGFKYSYTSDRSELVHSILSNAKTILAAVYIFFLVMYGFNKQTFLMFLGYVFLLLVEQSRWYFVSVLVATSFYLQNTGKLKNKAILIAFIFFAILLSYVGLLRENVKTTDLSLLLNPFYIEGDYGSYMILQTYDIIRKGVSFFTFFIDYLVDPVIYLIPRIIFMQSDVSKDSIGLFKYFVISHQYLLDEPYAPVGGFNYIAQASSALPFVGPLIVTFLFAKLTVKVESGLYKTKFKELFYYLYSAGFMFVFIKTIFDQTIKYFLTLLIPALILFYIMNANKKTC